MRTRIDSGAKLASLHCNCITPIKRDGEDWDSFTVTTIAGDKIRLERKVQRIVIELGICLGRVHRKTELSLIDRAGLTYPMLPGRAFMGKDFLVDTAETYINPPHCEWPGKR